MSTSLHPTWLFLALYQFHHFQITSSTIFTNDTIYDIECDDDDGRCVISCFFNDSCSDLNITSEEFLLPEVQNITNFSTLSVHCLASGSCHGLAMDCGALNVENCTVSCLADDSCFGVDLFCGSLQRECSLTTIDSFSAISDSSVDCHFGAENGSFCGYQCGLESDGCSEVNICLDHGFGTKCSCSGSKEACDAIFYGSDIDSTTTTASSPTTTNTASKTTYTKNEKESNFEQIWSDLMDHKAAVIGGIGGGICLVMMAVMGCWYRMRMWKYDHMERLITEEIDIPLKQELLKNDTLNQKKGTMQYNDSAELAHFQMFRESDIGSSLFEQEVVDKKM